MLNILRKLGEGCSPPCRVRVSLVLVLLLLALAAPSSASYISLKTRLASQVDKGTLRVMVTSINKGDESAYNVQAEIEAGGKRCLLDKIQELYVNQTYSAMREIRIDPKSKGQYPLVLIMHYADANQYPFSALNVQTYSVRSEETPSEILGKVRPAAFWKKGKSQVALKNMGKEALSVSTRLVLPCELSAEPAKAKLELSAGGEGKFSFSVENFSALNGSTYQVFAVSEYDKQGLHYTQITPGLIKIVEGRGILGLDYKLLLWIAAGLAALFIAAQFVRKK